MYVQPILNSFFTNTSLCQHIYAKQIPSQKSSHHATLNLIITLVCTSSYLSQAQPKRETTSIIPQTRCFYTNQSPWPTIPCRHRWIQTKMLKQNQLEMKRKLRTSSQNPRGRFWVLKPQQGSGTLRFRETKMHGNILTDLFLSWHPIPMNRISLRLLRFVSSVPGTSPNWADIFFGFVKKDDQPWKPRGVQLKIPKW